MTDPQRMGKYELLEEIGRGGFAIVYKARDTELGRLVALKVLHPYWSEDPGFAARFRQEARGAAGLRHSNIVTVYEAGEASGHLYIAMEYLPGRTLQNLLEAEGALTLERASPVLEQLADALDYAHSQGVIHRDIKPVNIMLEETRHGVRVILMDFGLVKAMEGSTALTSQGTLLGTPEYMAPEQADPDRAAEIGPATDRYAFGVVAYQMLTGRVPFVGNTPATLNAHEHKPVPHPRSLRPDLPEPVANVLLKMLSKSPAERYASAGEFVTALHGASRIESQPRQQETLVRQLPREAKRVRNTSPSLPWVWIAAGLAAALAIVAGGVIASRALPPRPALTPTLRAPAATPMPTAALMPTATVVPSAAALAATGTSTPAPAATRVRAADGMVMVPVPGGSFPMGSSGSDPNAEGDEMPQHTVTLAAFWIDRTEVTNAQYNRCAQVHVCQPSGFATNLKFNGADQPVVGVSWDDADTYCQWAGAALPTEAQWEKAARGTDGRIYPWGDQPATCEYAVMNGDQGPGCGRGAAWPVGSKPKGASPYGALDMAGNVYEWTADWYDRYPGSTFQSDFFGLKYRAVRGGGYTGDGGKLRAARRARGAADFFNESFGFRCAVAGP